MDITLTSVRKAWGFAEMSEATGLSVPFLRKEVTAGNLRATRVWPAGTGEGRGGFQRSPGRGFRSTEPAEENPMNPARHIRPAKISATQ